MKNEFIIHNFFDSRCRIVVFDCRRKPDSTDEPEPKYPENEENSIVSQQESIASETVYVNGKLTFVPPVYIQRYDAVFSSLQKSPWRDTIKKVVDFGCSELGFFLYLKQLSGLEEILEVDIDENALERGVSRAAPLNTDYLFCKREKPLNVYVLSGNIAEYDYYLMGTDAVVAIEVIEHLHPDVLNKLSENIFYNIRPKIAVFTTPNADFNKLFPANTGGFRHPDHKFEWSRKEFSEWTEKIVEKYPNYSVQFYGIGAGPRGTEDLGCCTQMAVFTKISEPEYESPHLEVKGAGNYKLIRKYEYPFYVDNRSNEEKILNEVLYRVNFTMDEEQYYNNEDCCSEFPLCDIMEYVSRWCDSEEQLKKILLEHGFHVKERDGSDFLLYWGRSETSYRTDEESSADYNIPEYTQKADLPTENWDLDFGAGNHSTTSDKVHEEDLLSFFSSASQEESVNAKAGLESDDLSQPSFFDAGERAFGALPTQPLNDILRRDHSHGLVANSFKYMIPGKIPKKRKKIRYMLIRNPSRMLVRSFSLPIDLCRNSESWPPADDTRTPNAKSFSQPNIYVYY